MSDSEKPKQLEVEELTECSECKSEHIVRDYKRGEITCRNFFKSLEFGHF